MDGSDQQIPLHLSEVFWSVGFESDGRERRRRWISPARVSGFAGVEVRGSGVNSSDVLRVPRGYEVDDSMQNGEANSRDWSMRTGASWRETEVRLERTRAEVASGHHPIRRSSAREDRKKGSGGCAR
jgi:hypothetical protein